MTRHVASTEWVRINTPHYEREMRRISNEMRAIVSPSGQTVVEALRGQFGSNAEIAKSAGYTRGSTEYKSFMRSLQRMDTTATQQRGLGAANAAKLAALPGISPELKTAIQQGSARVKPEAPEGTLTMQWHGDDVHGPSAVEVSEDERDRDLEEIDIGDDPLDALDSPMDSYIDNYGMPAFGGEGHFTITYKD